MPSLSKPSRTPAARAASHARRTWTPGESVRVEYDQAGADAMLDGLLDEVLKAVRPAAQAGAQTLYVEALLRCPVSAEAHVFYGTDSVKTGVTWTFQPGNLRNAIYQAFSKDNSVEAGAGYQKATYHIAWNHKDAPYGFMVEFGTSRASAHPFLRPAYDSAARDALDDARVELGKQLRAAGVTA